MNEKDKTLADGLRELMELAKKYEFSEKDFTLLMDRTLLLGEAMIMMQDLGLYDELSKRHKAKCKTASEVLYP